MKELSTYSKKELRAKINAMESEIMKMVRDVRQMQSKFCAISRARTVNFDSNLEEVIADIKTMYGVDLTLNIRHSDVVAYRSCLMYILTENCEISLAEIGRLLGRKDHSTVIHARDKVADFLSINDEYYTIVYSNVLEIFNSKFEI